jgi:Serum amyloid A protein
MEDANTKPDAQGGADKYFHCKGHCEACNDGPGGVLASYVIGYGREATDPVAAIVKGNGVSSNGGAIDVIKDIPSDLEANEKGREAAEAGQQCAAACRPLGPRWLPPRYESEVRP